MFGRTRITRDHQAAEIDRLSRELRAARRKGAELEAELRGMRTGQHLVLEQLARDLRLGATREEQHRVRGVQAYTDQQQVLRIVAGHVLDARGSAQEPEVVGAFEALAEELTAAGIPLRPALLAAQIERADAHARVSAAEAAAAVANAPTPHPHPRSAPEPDPGPAVHTDTHPATH